MLNHFTLSVSNPEIKREIARYHTQQVLKIIKPWCAIEVSLFLYVLAHWFFTDFVMWSYLMQSSLSVVAVVAIALLVRFNKHGLMQYVLYAMFAGQCVVISLAYGRTFKFETIESVFADPEIVLHYVALSLLPIHSFYMVFILLTPWLLAAVSV